MRAKIIIIFLGLILFTQIFGQEQQKDNFFFRDSNTFYLGFGVGFSLYDQHYLNTHFKKEEDRNEYGFECGIFPGFWGNVSLNFILIRNLDLSLNAEITTGSEWCILGDNNTFTIYSTGFDVKKHFPLGSGRHSVFGAIGAKFSYFDFSGYHTLNEGLRFGTGINFQSKSIMVQPFAALNIARTMHGDVTILPKYIYSDFQIGVELFF